MGLLNDAKEVAETAAKKAGEWAHEQGDRLSDKVDEVKADAEVKHAEAQRDAVHAKNDAKERLRDS